MMVDQPFLRAQIDDYLYVEDFDGLNGLKAVLNNRLDIIETDLARYELTPASGPEVDHYFLMVREHWDLCQVMAYLLFRKQQTERHLLRAAIDGVMAPGSVPSQRRATYLQRLVDEQDVSSGQRAVAVMRHMVGEFEQLQAKVRIGMQSAPLGALYESEAVMERAEDALGTLANDILFLERNLDLGEDQPTATQ